MTDAEIRAAYLDELIGIAPDLDPATIAENDHLQDDLDLDSMDVLSLVVALDKRLGVAVPEADYPKIATVGLAVPYLRGRLG